MTDKLLLVDDDELLLACMQRILRSHFVLDTALGPSAALDAVANSGPYSVVISDMRMPGLNGVQLLVKVKALAPKTVGMILSGNLQDVEAEPLYHDVVFRILEKPCPPQQLVDCLKEAFTHHKASAG